MEDYRPPENVRNALYLFVAVITLAIVPLIWLIKKCKI